MGVRPVQRSWWESLLLVVVFVGMLGFMLNSFFLEQRVAKQNELLYQLGLMRNGSNLFAFVEKRFPDSLVELGMTVFKLPGDSVSRRYVERMPINADGVIADPFGHPYKYDKKAGWVYSTTPGYEFW